MAAKAKNADVEADDAAEDEGAARAPAKVRKKPPLKLIIMAAAGLLVVGGGGLGRQGRCLVGDAPEAASGVEAVRCRIRGSC